MNKLIVIGGSAGSLKALFTILGSLRAGFPFPVLLVLHRQAGYDTLLDELLSKRTTLTAREIEEKDRIEPGNIYICPADYHVLIEEDESFSLDDSEKVNYSRPSLDVVFCSAADVYKDCLVAIVLSGANADGAEGLRYIREKGGITIVQDPADAEIAYMPERAAALAAPQYILDSAAIADLLNELAG